ncbi:MAG: hypothetical protein HQL54_11775 [Magnetococcales bacterium]|nr:hypothetical protein [Magnetococcales bacterium]
MDDQLAYLIRGVGGWLMVVALIGPLLAGLTHGSKRMARRASLIYVESQTTIRQWQQALRKQSQFRF